MKKMFLLVILSLVMFSLVLAPVVSAEEVQKQNQKFDLNVEWDDEFFGIQLSVPYADNLLGVTETSFASEGIYFGYDLMFGEEYEVNEFVDYVVRWKSERDVFEVIAIENYSVSSVSYFTTEEMAARLEKVLDSFSQFELSIVGYSATTETFTIQYEARGDVTTREYPVEFFCGGIYDDRFIEMELEKYQNQYLVLDEAIKYIGHSLRWEISEYHVTKEDVYYIDFYVPAQKTWRFVELGATDLIKRGTLDVWIAKHVND